MDLDRKTIPLESVVDRDRPHIQVAVTGQGPGLTTSMVLQQPFSYALRIHQQRMTYIMRDARFKTGFFATLICVVFVMCTPAATVRVALKTPGSRTAAPSFSLADASGRTHQLADYRGKVILLNFWATDCGGCRLEIPWLVDIHQNFKNERVSLIGISMDISYEDLKNAAEAWARVKPFVEARQITYPILMGDGEVTKRYDIQALPLTYLIDSRGKIAATYVGLIDRQ